MSENTNGVDPRYPIGPFQIGDPPESETRREVEEIVATPGALIRAVQGLDKTQLDTPYRDGGWTIRQVVHHLPDSHINAYVRIRMALTEESPEIKPYFEARWAELADARTGPVDSSLRLLESLHERWVSLLRSLTTDQFARTLRHPDLGELRVDQVICLYGWHGRHHVAHVTATRNRLGW